MQLSLESTNIITDVDGVMCRAWVGRTSSGIEVVALVALIAVPDIHQQDEFQRELFQQPAQARNIEDVVGLALTERGES